MHDQECQHDLEEVQNLVKAILFSRYDERKIYAQQRLQKELGRNTAVASLKDKGILYAYIHFKQPDLYILVSKHNISAPTFEEVPLDEERALWRSHEHNSRHKNPSLENPNIYI